MRADRVIFWQGEPSPHQSSYLRALAESLPDIQIVGVFERPLGPQRLALGWRSPDLGRMEVILAPSRGRIAELASQDPASSVHVLSGLRLPLVRRALEHCVNTNARVGILSEPRDGSGAMGKLRVLHSLVLERPYRKRIDFVLAIGHKGVRWYERCGYPSRKIFPWGYFVEQVSDSGLPSEAPRKGTDLLLSFVGRCVPGKGLEALFSALALLAELNWRLQVIGDGPLVPALKARAAQSGIAGRIDFAGVMANADARQRLAESDLLVFPSEIDGWGAVVNEALMAGIPVVCSDYCGAADLVRASGYGDTFRAGSATDLAGVLEKWMRRGPVPAASRRAAAAWSRHIGGEAAARYLIDIVNHVGEKGPRPTAPWFAGGAVA